VFDKLNNPKDRSYGRRPGSLLSRGGLRGGARQKRHEAPIHRRRIPQQLLNYENDANRLRAAETSRKEAQDRYRPKGSGQEPGGSFLSKLLDGGKAE